MPIAIDIAIAIILHPTSDAVLIAQRKSNVHLPGMWEFPGGKCEPGETPRDTVIRESLEEVGLVVEPIEDWPAITHAYPERTVVLHPFLCRAASADAKPLDNRQVVWAHRKSLRDYDFPEANAPLIERLSP